MLLGVWLEDCVIYQGSGVICRLLGDMMWDRVWMVDTPAVTHTGQRSSVSVVQKVVCWLLSQWWVRCLDYPSSITTAEHLGLSNHIEWLRKKHSLLKK